MVAEPEDAEVEDLIAIMLLIGGNRWTTGEATETLKTEYVTWKSIENYPG